MKLPTIAVPTHSLVIPSTKKEVSYRPYLTKEEKLLLMAKESGKESDMLNALKKLIEDCVDGIDDAGKLPVFDFEYIFLKLRQASSGETLAPTITCDGELEDEEGNTVPCGEKVIIPIDLATIEPTYHEGHDNKIVLNDDGVGVIMRYPTLDTIKKLSTGKLSETEIMFEMFLKCIEAIFDKDSTYPASETSRDEPQQFVESLPGTMREKIEKSFFNTMPSVEYKTSVTCKKCGKVHEVHLKGIRDFF